MSKTEAIDFSDDRLLTLAASRLDNHNLIGALKLLNKNAELNFDDDRSFMLYAEVFDDMELYEKSVNKWFRYMDEAPEGDLADAYEGLAVNYMNLDNEHFAAYYYNKLLVETDDLSPESRREIIDSFLRKQENPLKFAWPPKIADYSAEMSRGVELMRAQQYDKAIEEFDKVAEGNPRYFSARNYIAMCRIISDKCDEAEAECRAILEKKPDDVQALTTLAAVKTEQKKAEEGRELAYRLVKLGATDPDDMYKIATVCCENKLHAEAFALFNKLEGEFSYDTTVLYFKAISAYNSGNYDACFEAFDKILAINPDAVVARFYMLRARENVRSGKKEEFGYFYRLPQDVRESSLEFISSFYRLPKRSAMKLAKEVNILECIKWCFDELENTEDNQLHLVAALCAVKAGFDDYVRGLLLDAFLSDSLKISILHDICSRNEDNQFGVVICNIYKCVDIYALHIGRAKRKNFLSAYSVLVSRFGILDESYSAKFCGAAERLYKNLAKKGMLASSGNLKALAAAIFTVSGIRESDVPADNVCSFFDADKAAYDEIMEAML